MCYIFQLLMTQAVKIGLCVHTKCNHVNSVNLVNSVNHFNSVNHVNNLSHVYSENHFNSVNHVNSVNRVNSIQHVAPSSLMVFLISIQLGCTQIHTVG